LALPNRATCHASIWKCGFRQKFPSPDQKAGFITTFLRGTEWAFSGKVTQKIPADFPSADKTSARPFKAPGGK
jgi:hypothetical protein